MSHKAILLLIFFCTLTFATVKIIKNKPGYLLLLGIRGLFTLFFLHFVNYLCATANLAIVIAANPVSVATGAFLGLPGIILLYASGIYMA
jgi:inhibitor of the pro-sigma K processing machinery